MTKLPHPRAESPLLHPARPGADKINLQLLAAAFVRAMARKEFREQRAEQLQEMQQLRKEATHEA